MNFLAHFHLAWPDSARLAGALEGEYFKGVLKPTDDHPLAVGISQHRSIDAFTDAHADIVALRARFPTALRRYAGILIDLAFDHWLTRHWQTFSDVPFEDFVHEVYTTVDDLTHCMGDPANRMFSRMVEHDILSLYNDWDTVAQAARNIGRRFKRGNPLEDIAGQLNPLKPAMETTFLAFYPKLQRFNGELLTRLGEVHKT